MVRRRSRRRKRSYRNEGTGSGAEARIEDLSPRAQRLVESGVINLSTIDGSGEGGRITSGDILHAARVMEMEQSVARIETVGRLGSEAPTSAGASSPDRDSDVSLPADASSSDPDDGSRNVELVVAEVNHAASADLDSSPAEPAVTVDTELPAGSELPANSEATMSSAADIGGQPIEVPPDPWDAYNGSSDGLAEVAMPGAEQSWGEAEANIAAIVEEAAARLYGHSSSPVAEPVPVVEESGGEPSGVAAEPDPIPDRETQSPESIDQIPVAAQDVPGEYDSNGLLTPPAFWQPDIETPPLAGPPLAASAEEMDVHIAESQEETVLEQPEQGEVVKAVTAISSEEAPTTPVGVEQPVELVSQSVAPVEEVLEDAGEMEQPVELVSQSVAPVEEVLEDVGEMEQPAEIVMDFGTLEQVDPASVWEDGAEYFAPWFLAHSKQLGNVLGLQAGLSDAHQYTTKSATGVLGRDDNGEDVIVVSSEHAAATDPDLGRALGMAAASGAATVALVSARFDDELLQALAWLNSQTKSGVKWFGIEMKVVRIADSPPAMLFELVASPPG